MLNAIISEMEFFVDYCTQGEEGSDYINASYVYVSILSNYVKLL